MTSPSQSAVNALDAALSAVAVAPAALTGWVRATGSDRVRWLNGMVTNSVQALEPGQGAYTFLLNAQGRIQGDAMVWADTDELLLQTSASQTAPMIEMLDRFIIMDEVELADASNTLFGVRVVGPQAAETLQAMGLTVPDTTDRWIATQWMGHSVRVQSLHAPLVPRYELWASSAQVAQELIDTLLARGAVHAGDADLEALRVLEGTPLYGTDIRDRDLPQETGQMRALHFNKGCYLGQEIVERIRSRGNVHRTFHAFELHGEIPAAGAALEAEGKPVGELTSFAQVHGRTYALGFIRREAVERHLPITYAGGSAQPLDSPIALATS